MSQDLAISVRNLTKTYELGKIGANTLREQLSGLFSNRKENTLNALDDLSFDLKSGDSLGIIGKNGAGKSTLLKVLSRITVPTRGNVKLYGRVTSLLEVGTGFHPELTGRENIFLNGSILGMTRIEINRVFDEIVAFSGIESFLDTPVKRYSSGMYVRLAFAVAAHLEPEILIVDEVLAVGDIEFQKKCLSKMSDVANSGRSIILVSHNMKAVETLCDKALVLESGRAIFEGDVSQAIQKYIESSDLSGASKNWDLNEAPEDEMARLFKVSVKSIDNDGVMSFDVSKEIHVEIEYELRVDGSNSIPCIQISDRIQRIVLFSGEFHDSNWVEKEYKKGRYRAICTIPSNTLAEGSFIVSVKFISQNGQGAPPANHLQVDEAATFQTYDKLSGMSSRGLYSGQYRGLVRPVLNWKISRNDI